MNLSVQPDEEGRSSGVEGGGWHAPVPATASACRRTCWVVGWLALVLIGINLVHDASMHDKTLVPRLHAARIKGLQGFAAGWAKRRVASAPALCGIWPPRLDLGEGLALERTEGALAQAGA